MQMHAEQVTAWVIATLLLLMIGGQVAYHAIKIGTKVRKAWVASRYKIVFRQNPTRRRR